MNQITQLLNKIDAGEIKAASDLLPLVYEELRRLATQKMEHEKAGQTLQATDLVHEAYLRLIGPANVNGFANHHHFFAAAAEAMERLLIEQARRKHSLKHGGHLTRQDLPDLAITTPLPIDDLLAIHEILADFKTFDPVKAQIVQLHFFLGMTLDEVARVLDLSPATVDRYWTYARTWLKQRLDDADRKPTASEISQNDEAEGRSFSH